MEITFTYILLSGLIVFAFRFMIKRRYLDLIGVFILINTLTSITVEFFPEGALHTGYFRYVIAIILVFYLLIEIKPFKITPIVYVIILYLIVLSITNSSNIANSLQSTGGLAMSLIMFGVAFKVFNSGDDFLKLYNYLTIAATAIVIQYIYANIFQIGRSPYIGDFFFTGGASVGAMSILVFYILVTPIIVKMKKRIDLYQIILISISVIMILLLFRRGAVLGLAVGSFVLAVYYFRSKYTIYLASLTLIVISISFIFVGDRIIEIYEQRSDPTEFVEGTAGRVAEATWVYDSFKRHEFYKIFTGIETFNSADYFSRTIGRQRYLHTDYIVLLHGAGIIGVVLFIIYYISLFKYKNKVPMQMRGVYLSLLIASLVISYSGLFLGISNYSYLLILLGAISGVDKHYRNQNSNDMYTQ